MNQKSSYAFRLVLGVWLTYLGISLLYQMYKERPSNMVLISAIAAVFVIVGAVCAIHSLLKIFGIRMPKLFRNFKKKKTEKSEEPKVQQFIPTDSNVQPVALTAVGESSQAENEASAKADADAENQETDAAMADSNADEPEKDSGIPQEDEETPEDGTEITEDNADAPESDADEPAAQTEAEGVNAAETDGAEAGDADDAVETSASQEQEKLRTSASDVEILEVTEEEKDDHADELENDYEEK